MQRVHGITALIFIFFMLLNLSFAGGNPEVGKQLAASCVACHGQEGKGIIATNPKLAGQNEKYFIAQMNAYKKGQNGGRVNAVMQAIAGGLSEQQIADLAAYYANQSSQSGEVEEKYVSQGQLIYRGGVIEEGIPACSACHAPQGRGNVEAGIPLIGGQFATYTMTQLESYKNGSRKGGLNDMMGIIAKKLSQEQILMVANYIQGLH